MRQKKLLRLFMLAITVFSTAFITVYTMRLTKKEPEEKGIYSNTLYNSLMSNNENTVMAMESGNLAESENNSQIKSNTTTSSFESGSEVIGYASDTQNGTASVNVSEIKVYNHKSKSISVMPIEEYTAAVVVAEMPASSPAEALKAQAVAVRTLAVNYILDSDKSEHYGADICTDSSHCQGFADKSEFIQKYPNSGEKVFRNAENAASSTKGLVLLYDSKPIIAVFHASSGTSTASSKEIWGGELDYLVSVQTDELKDNVLREQVINSVTFTRDEFISKLSKGNIPELDKCKESPFHIWISDKKLSESGRVSEITIAGAKIKGSELRRLLGLKSADFEISFQEDSITFVTRGYGHGVGMSQLGAVAMAKKGESFYSILGKYYPGTIIGIV